MSAAGNATNPGPQLLNPYTPMAWVTPTLAREMTIQLLFAVGSLSVLLWDIVMHLPEDYKLLTKYRINFSFFVYCISRIATLGYVLGMVIAQTAPIGNCGYIRDISFMYIVALLSTLLPFVARVSALYGNNKFVVTFFSLLWLCVLASAIAVAIGTSAFRVGKTNYCAQSRSKKSSVLTAVALAYDTLIFVATSRAFMGYSYTPVSLKRGFRDMVLGEHLFAFSKSILRDGQAYYLISLAVNVVNVVVMAAFAKDNRFVYCNPTIVIMNNMSCYVYRNIRFGFYQDYTIYKSAIIRSLGTDGEQGKQHDGPTATQFPENMPDRDDPEVAYAAERRHDCHEMRVFNSNGDKDEMNV